MAKFKAYRIFNEDNKVQARLSTSRWRTSIPEKW